MVSLPAPWSMTQEWAREQVEEASIIPRVAYDISATVEIIELLPKVLWLTGPHQRVGEEHLDRFGFVDAIATPIWIEIAPLFKRIELSGGDVDWSPMETACSATSETVRAKLI